MPIFIGFCQFLFCSVQTSWFYFFFGGGGMLRDARHFNWWEEGDDLFYRAIVIMAGVVWRGFRRQHPLAGNQGNSRILQDAPGFLMMLKVGTRPSPPWCWSQRLGRTVDPAGSSLSINAICCRVGILDGFFESLNHSIQPISFPPPPSTLLLEDAVGCGEGSMDPWSSGGPQFQFRRFNSSMYCPSTWN